MKNNSILLAILLISTIFILSACAPDADHRDDTIRIGVNNIAEDSIADVEVSNMWQILLQENGYNVEVIEVGKEMLFQGVAQGNLDIGMEVLIPQDNILIEEYGADFDIQDKWYKETRYGLVVPSYVEVNSISELNEKKDILNNEIIGIEPGSNINELTEKAIEEYGLDFEVVEISEPAMIEALGEAYEDKEPIAVTLWKPHRVYAYYDLKHLDDPNNIYGDGDDIAFITREGFAEDFSDVVQWMNNWFMTDENLSDLMAIIEEEEDPVNGANAWVNENRDLIDEWITN
ncbi:Glycine betaine ABC transport system, glycine betaine-binding protein OpuAC [Candidatus Syntrophocurvum alkaliphilum]|uniref:Glycine betaine ABC transport system, glycine betaine-binding protein OpuAC n=1 Tax=Candidatus Syntrophocurvum alkaliphilum TaxID=2293317 RepID=A0A6I6DL26_9FIRM|nr:glycine betaine ABC transporter substrate-binding protein [Candidatus Syntrophocurvum alkaliphilum]QGU00175.1 Glycine betaine ABC transport system, glycine betaine-binding protein OpuAC [Candidatus Syntrophocurvum alkaliphilum]